ncbi:hypothetical protein [Mobilicoccus massiliensis]|uniref:hypothetical protein n=1 Tax=Mobilicoccus massiliensis TaxID=1522310 RepID=UPI0011435572|nr:hypothetical protein [Mobilicoccus massiliensis]
MNLPNGNLEVRDTDLKINAPGVATRSDGFYNGLSARTGTFGSRWSMAGGQDVGLEITSSKVSFRGPSGFRAAFTGSGSSWTAPSGLNATLTKDADGTSKVKEEICISVHEHYCSLRLLPRWGDCAS